MSAAYLGVFLSLECGSELVRSVLQLSGKCGTLPFQLFAQIYLLLFVCNLQILQFALQLHNALFKIELAALEFHEPEIALEPRESLDAGRLALPEYGHTLAIELNERARMRSAVNCLDSVAATDPRCTLLLERLLQHVDAFGAALLLFGEAIAQLADGMV